MKKNNVSYAKKISNDEKNQQQMQHTLPLLHAFFPGLLEKLASGGPLVLHWLGAEQKHIISYTKSQ